MSTITLRMVQTTYKGPTDFSGSRVIAKHMTTGKRKVVPWDYALDAEENHQRAAAQLLGSMPSFRCALNGGGYIFAIDPSKVTDYEAFVLHVRALRSTYPDMSFSDAARRARTADPELASRVLDSVGSWPASDPEIRALQGLPQ